MFAKYFAVPALALAAAGIGAALPASAASAAPAPVETVALSPWFASGPGRGAVGVYELADAPQLEMEMNLPATGTYTDLHFRTSNPGSAKGCTMADLARYRQTHCTVTLPDLKNNEVRTYSVTLTGKRNGVAFSRTSSIKLRGTSVSARVFVNGQDTTRYTAQIRGTKANVRYEVTNRSAVPLRNLEFFSGDIWMANKCHIPYVAPGKAASCTFTLTLGEEALGGLVKGQTGTFPGLTGQGEKGWNVYLNVISGAFTFVK